MGDTEETQEMKQLIEEIKETEAQLDLNSSEYIEDNDVKIFIKLANYIRDKVGSPDNMERMISNICKLYSAKSSFETDMKDILKGVKGETDWFEKNKIRNFHNYMEALVSVHYVSDNSSDNQLKARSGERLNGIPIALRYAMFRDGVHPDYLPKLTFENMRKLQKESTDIFFPKKGTKRIGLYNDTGKPFAPPTTKDEFEEFHAQAASILEETNILGLDSRDKQPRRRRKTKRKKVEIVDEPVDVTLYDTLPDFLSMTKAAINANINTEPLIIPLQDAAECGVHAVNNLLQSDFTLENFRKVQGEMEWFEIETLEIVLGSASSLGIDEIAIDRRRWRSRGPQLTEYYASRELERFPNHFMEDDNLVGLIFYLGPAERGHWTSMKRWASDGFTYMDSNKTSENAYGGLVKTLPKDRMVDYILNEVTFVTAFIAVYKDESSRTEAIERFSSLNATDDAGGDITDDAGGTDDTDPEPSPPVYDDDDKETLIDFVLSKRDSLSTKAANYIGESDGMRERCWALIELNVIRRIRNLLKKLGIQTQML